MLLLLLLPSSLQDVASATSKAGTVPLFPLGGLFAEPSALLRADRPTTASPISRDIDLTLTFYWNGLTLHLECLPKKKKNASSSCRALWTC